LHGESATAEAEFFRPAPPRERLAQHLYETMERLAPGHSNYVEWRDLTQWHRDLCLNCIDALLDESDLIRRSLDLADDDMVKGRFEEREESDVNDKICPQSVYRAAPSAEIVQQRLR
jgi:hypothetical protein